MAVAALLSNASTGDFGLGETDNVSPRGVSVPFRRAESVRNGKGTFPQYSLLPSNVAVNSHIG